jgi:ABC-type nitrate/sulfonate/bicarbonate transport system ATPase subunit
MGETAAKIELRGIHTSFAAGNGTLEVLHDLSLEVAPAQFVSIIGPSGCGKSTMFNIMAGLEPATSGEVLVDGRTAHASLDFAYMPQKDLLFPWRRVLGNTILGLEIQGVSKSDAHGRALPLFEAFGLAGFENAYPHELSGGMRQRAALLRTVIQGTSVILLDEPFGALDSLTRTDMQDWLARVWEQFKWTVLLITHDIREAILLGDVVYVLTRRPATVRSAVPVELPRPRTHELLGTDRFVALERRLITELHEEAVAAATTGGAG